MKQIFPTDYRDPVEHEQWLELHPSPVIQVEGEPDYSFIDRLFERLEEMR